MVLIESFDLKKKSPKEWNKKLSNMENPKIIIHHSKKVRQKKKQN